VNNFCCLKRFKLVELMDQLFPAKNSFGKKINLSLF
jgi:hypothetical protein